MPIDPSREQLHTLGGVARGRIGWFVNPRTGAPYAFGSILRFAKKGVHGVRLETIRIGGSIVTSDAALRRFVDRLSGDDDGSTGEPRVPRPAPSSGGHDDADGRCDAFLRGVGI